MTRRLLGAMSGHGKSYLAQSLIERNIPEFEHVAVLDFKDEYRGLVKAGFASHFIVGPKEAAWNVSVWESFLAENGAVVLARYNLPPDEWQTVCARIIKAARRLGDSLTAIDEAHFVAPQTGKVPDAIEGLATTGRGEGASSLWITQRLAKLEKTVVSQCDETVLGAFAAKQDRNQIQAEYPVDVHNPAVSRVSSLPEELHAPDAGPVPLRQFEDDAGHTIGSEWVFANTAGEMDRWDTRNLSMESTHYGPEGNPIHDPNL